MPVMPSPAHKQKIVRAFFQKRVIELQTAVTEAEVKTGGTYNCQQIGRARAPNCAIGHFPGGVKPLVSVPRRNVGLRRVEVGVEAAVHFHRYSTERPQSM